jgi:hypothetical protein
MVEGKVYHPPTKSVILKQLACGLEGENVFGTRRDVTFVCEVSTFVNLEIFFVCMCLLFFAHIEH